MVAEIIIAVVCLAGLVGFIALFVWTRRSERDIELPVVEHTNDERQAAQLGIAAAQNGTFSR